MTLHQQLLDQYPEHTIGVIYSIAESSAYIVEILSKQNNYILSENDRAKTFLNLSLAKKAAISERVTIAFQALENIYQEIGSETLTNADSRFEYVEIPLK